MKIQTKAIPTLGVGSKFWTSCLNLHSKILERYEGPRRAFEVKRATRQQVETLIENRKTKRKEVL